MPRSFLQSIGVLPGMTRAFLPADGRRLYRETGSVLAALDGVTMPIPVMFADENESPVLGATALEILGFAVDPIAKKLVPRDLLALESSCQAGERLVNEPKATRAQEQLREEFNRWADSGKGEDMEREHRPIVEPTLELMQLAATDNVLDAGCGAGWLVRMISARVTEGRVVGMDISDEMVHRARCACTALENAVFVVGGVDEIPWESNFFTKVISVESSYYWPDPARGMHEIFRVLREGGSAWILINYYRDNPYCHQWGEKLAVATHLLSADEWAQLFRDAGFADVAHRRIVDPTPVPEVYTGRWFRNAVELKAFREIGALLIHGTKPVA